MRWQATGLAAAAAAATVAALVCCQAPQVSPGKPVAPGRPAAQPAPAAPAESRGGPIELFVTGGDDGYLDACGCDDGLLGGLPRRHTVMRYLGLDDGHALVLSNGGLVTRRNREERELALPMDRDKFAIQLQAMLEMRYAAVALTADELALGRKTLVECARIVGDDCPFVATNLVDAGPKDDPALPPLPFQRSVVRTVRGRSIAVLAVIASSEAAAVTAADGHVSVVPAGAAVNDELQKLRGASKPPDRTVLLAQATLEEAKALAKEAQGVDVLVVPGPAGDEPPADHVFTIGATDLITTGHKGKFVVRYTFGDGDDRGDVKPEPVENKDSIEKSPAILPLLETYRDLLKEDAPIKKWYARLPDKNGAAYAGADEATCSQCHAQAWETWKRSNHARAWRTLVEQDLPPPPGSRKTHQKNAIWDPECVCCHVTGFGEKTGFRGLDHEKADAPLVNVTCEACHGPSGDHAERAMRGDSSYPGSAIARIATGAASSLCERCHDADNSTSFDLKEYWVGRKRGEQHAPVAHGKD
jgi:hypothetical protein